MLYLESLQERVRGFLAKCACKNNHSEPPLGKNITITVVSKVTTVLKKYFKMFHAVGGEGIMRRVRFGTVGIAPACLPVSSPRACVHTYIFVHPDFIVSSCTCFE